MSASVVWERFRQIEQPPKYGEKPFAQLVDAAFSGAKMSWSNRLRLLEEATNRKIRRGDAIDCISALQRQREKELAIPPRTKTHLFATRYAAFAAGYVALAVAWCVVMAMC